MSISWTPPLDEVHYLAQSLYLNPISEVPCVTLEADSQVLAEWCEHHTTYPFLKSVSSLGGG